MPRISQEQKQYYKSRIRSVLEDRRASSCMQQASRRKTAF
jgi:uncharacterized membrane protein